MANKLLNTLTLDGTSFDILNDRLPKNTICCRPQFGKAVA